MTQTLLSLAVIIRDLTSISYRKFLIVPPTKLWKYLFEMGVI